MFSARRKPKKVAREESATQDVEDDDTGPVVRRPGVVKTKSKLRLSFQPGESTTEETQAVKPPRIGPSIASTRLPNFQTVRDEESRPTYDKSVLEELRNSTPSTPRELQVYDSSNESALDIAAKFGVTPMNTSSTIPSAIEIEEKKQRRARLAKEQGAQDFIPLDGYDSDGEFKPQRMQVGTYIAKDTEKNTRLVGDDEDFVEGFEEFVDDPGRVTMGRMGMMEQARKEREAIKDMIDNAEGSEEDESDSEVERNHAYESAQTHHGMDGLAAHSQQRREANRPRQPKEILPIPKLSTALGRLREAVQQIELEKIQIEKRRADVRKERAEIKASQEHVQRSLEEAGKELERLQLETSADDTAALP